MGKANKENRRTKIHIWAKEKRIKEKKQIERKGQRQWGANKERDFRGRDIL